MGVAQNKMNELSHIQVDHLKHLTAFVQAQVEKKVLFYKKVKQTDRKLRLTASRK